MQIDPGFTALHEQTLCSQMFGDLSPGPILHDFQVVLDYLGTDGVKAAGKYNLLPIEAIPVLDERLARPLRLELRRPQLRSHPYLQGLHLLLRATGIVRIRGDWGQGAVGPGSRGVAAVAGIESDRTVLCPVGILAVDRRAGDDWRTRGADGMISSTNASWNGE